MSSAELLIKCICQLICRLWLFRMQEYFLKQLIVETHKLVVEIQNIFISIVLLVQVSLVKVVNWSMGWWIVDKSTSCCSIFQFDGWWMYRCSNHWRTVHFLSLGRKWITCWAFYGNSWFKESWCWINLFSIDWLAQDEECIV